VEYCYQRNWHKRAVTSVIIGLDLIQKKSFLFPGCDFCIITFQPTHIHFVICLLVSFFEFNHIYLLFNLTKSLQVPDLNSIPSSELKDGMFVKYTGMIQDMLNPVFYFDKYEVLDRKTQSKHMYSGRFKESLFCQVRINLLTIIFVGHIHSFCDPYLYHCFQKIF
jgi:hypothetical protein